MEFENQYLQYSEYIELGGTLTEMPFKILEFEARKKIDERTQRRLLNVSDIPQEVKMCMYKLINTLDVYNRTQEKGNISSESIDGYSVFYRDVSQTTTQAKNIELDNIIITYLINTVVNNTHILYLGVI